MLIPPGFARCDGSFNRARRCKLTLRNNLAVNSPYNSEGMDSLSPYLLFCQPPFPPVPPLSSPHLDILVFILFHIAKLTRNLLTVRKQCLITYTFIDNRNFAIYKQGEKKFHESFLIKNMRSMKIYLIEFFEHYYLNE